MPQLDIYSFAPVINWLIIIIFIFYIISVVKGLGVLNKILNYRRRNLEKRREGKEEQEEEGYYVGKKKGIKGENNVIKGGRVKEVEEVMNERKKVGSMSMSLVISEIDGVEIENNLLGIMMLMMLVTGVLGLIVIYNFLLLKENEEFGHISEGSLENSTPVVLQGSPGVPSGGNGDDDPDNDKKKKKAKEEEERKEKEKVAKNTGVSWGWWVCGALLVVVIIGGIIYYYWSEGEGTGNGGDKGNPPMPPSSPTPPSTNTESKNTGTFATGATRRSVQTAAKLAVVNAGGKLLIKTPTLPANSNNLTANSNNLPASANNLTANSTSLLASGTSLGASSSTVAYGEAEKGVTPVRRQSSDDDDGDLVVGARAQDEKNKQSSVEHDGESTRKSLDTVVDVVINDLVQAMDVAMPVAPSIDVSSSISSSSTSSFKLERTEIERLGDLVTLIQRERNANRKKYESLNEKQQVNEKACAKLKYETLKTIIELIDIFWAHTKQEKLKVYFGTLVNEYNTARSLKLNAPDKSWNITFIEEILAHIMRYLKIIEERDSEVSGQVKMWVEIVRNIVERIKKNI